MGTVENPSTKASSRSRAGVLLLAFNVILLGSLLYTTFGRSLTPSGGVSISLGNDLPSAMIDLKFEYPGGKLELPRMDAGQHVGHPISNVKEFDAALTFKDEEGHAFKESVHIKPVDEFLIVIEVLPVFEPTTVKSAEGAEVSVVKASPSKVKVLTVYQPPVSYN